MGDQNNQRRLKVALGAIIVLILLLLGSCGLRKLFDSGKLDNSMTVTEVQENNPSSYLPYSDKEQFVDFIGAENGEGEITYEIVKAVDENNKKVSYFTLKDDKTAQIRVAPNTPAGTYLVTIKAKASGDETHKAAELEFTVKIRIGGKKDGSFDVLPTAKDGLLYTGNSMDLINPGSSSSGTIYYKVNDGEWSTSIPQGKEAGIYTVYYKLVGDSSHNDVPERSFTVEIKSPSSSGSNKNTKPSGSGSSSQGGSGSGGDTPSGGGGGGQVDYNVGSKPTSKTVTYNGKKQSIDYSTPAHVNVSGEAAGTNAGTYTATYTPESGYYWSDGSTSPVTVTLTINRESVGEKPSDKTVTYDGKYHCLDYAKPSTVDVSGAAEGTNVGKYSATYTPKENYCWSDGSTAPVTATLTINRASVGDKPQSKSVEYNGGTQSIDYKAPSTVNVKGKASGKNVGKYSATYTPKENYCWSDGTTGSVKATLTINRASVGDKPESKTVDYNGETQSIDYVAPNTVKVKGKASGKDAGTYSATYTPKDNYCWSDGTTSSVKATLTIKKLSVGDKPVDNTVDFNGQTQSIDYDKPDTVDVRGNASGIEVGTYSAYYTPKKNYCWSDGTSSTVKATLTIKASGIERPTNTSVTTTFNGRTQTNGYDKPDGINMSGKDRGRNAGTYTAEYTPDENHTWSDGKRDTVTVTLTIEKKQLDSPYIDGVDTFVYDGNYHKVDVDGYNPLFVDLDGNTGRKKDVGNYKITASIRDKVNYEWKEDPKDEDRVLEWSITAKKLAVPEVATEFVYNGKLQRAKEKDLDDNYDRNLMDVVRHGGGINAGEYEMVIRLRNTKDYVWEDGTTDNQTIVWEIKKAENPIYVIDDQTIDTIYYASDHSVLFAPATRAKGEVSYSLVSAEKRNSRSLALGEKFIVSGNEITIKGGTEEGIYDLVVKATAAGDKNYEAGEKEIKITLAITASGIDKPTDLEVVTSYNGKEQTNGYEKPDGVTMTGSDRGTNAGKYEATYTPDKNHAWSDGTTDPVTVVLTIDKQKLNTPYIDGESTFVYDGNYHRADVDGYNPLLVNLSGDILIKKHVGDYTITASIRDKVNYEWAENPDADKELKWSITAKKLTVPEVVTEFVYNGKFQMAKEDDLNEAYDKSLMKVTTHGGGVGAGDYAMFISLRNTRDCVWDDKTEAGTTDDQMIVWTIKKAENPMHVVDPQTTAAIYNPLDHSVLFAPASKAVGEVTYTLTSATERGTDASDRFELTENNSIKIKGDTANGAYDLVINVKATGDDNYAEAEKDIHLKLTIAGIRYVVVFDGNGATSGETDNQDFYGTIIKKHLNGNEYEREGYYFTGWNTKSDGTGDYFSDRVFIDFRDIAPYAESGITTLYAQWSPSTLNITYDLDGGKFADGIEVPYEFTAETESFTLPQPEKEGYRFAGWTGTDLTEPTNIVVVSKGTTTDRVYKANWEAKTFYVLYLNGNSLFEIGTAVYGQPYGDNLKNIHKDGYESYWYTVPDTGFNIVDHLGTKVTADTIVDDTWTKLIWDQFMDYLSEQGLDIIKLFIPDNADLIVLFGRHTPYTNTPFTVEHYVLPLNSTNYSLLKEETRFGTTDAEMTYEELCLDITGFHFGRGKNKGGMKIKADGSSVFEIYYDRNEYSVTFDSKGGSDVKEQRVLYEAKAIEPFEPEHADPDYEFTGWYWNGELYDFNRQVKEDIHLVASWKYTKTAEIKTCVNKERYGTVTGGGRYPIGSGVTLEAVPNSGYRFVKWSDGNTDNPRLVVVEGDAVYKAIFDDIGLTSLLEYEEMTYYAKAGEAINVKELFKSLALIDEYSISPEEVPVEFQLDKQLIKHAYLVVSEDALPGYYEMSLTVTPYWNDFVHRTSTVNITIVVEGITHEVEFDSMGGTDVKTQIVNDGEYAAYPFVERNGYILDGWYLEDAEEPFDFYETPITEDIKLYAKWLKSFTVSFDSEVGELIRPQIVLEGDTAEDPGAPTYEGEEYVFAGWYFNGRLYDFDTPIYDDITLTAIWTTKDTRLITTFVNDDRLGYVTGGGVYNVGEKIELFARANDGFVFNKWSDGNTSNPRTITVTENKEYVAEFKAIGDGSMVKYSFRSYENKLAGGPAFDVTDNFVNSSLVNIIDSITCSPNNGPVKFSYRSRKATITVSKDAEPGEYILTLTVNPNFIGRFVGYKQSTMKVSVAVVEELYTVTFDSNGGSDVPEQLVGPNGHATRPEAPRRDGFEFEYWYSDDPNTAFNFDVEEITEDITLTAKWAKAYVVSFDSAGGSYVSPQNIYSDESGSECAYEPEDPVWTGHNFAGWYLGDEPFDFDTPIESNITLTAHWNDKQNYTVYYENVLGYRPRTDVKWSDDDLAPANRPSDTILHRFAGWYVDEECTVAYKNQSYAELARYDEDVASVTLYADWMPRTIVDYREKFTSTVGEEASFEIRNSDHWYMLYYEYEIISGNDSGMFRMSADKNHVIISPLAKPGTYYITVSSQSLIPIEQLDDIQHLMIEWTVVEPEPEPVPVEPEPEEAEQSEGEPVDGQTVTDGTDGVEVEGGNRDAETPAPQAVNPDVVALPGETPTIKPEGEEDNIPQVEKEPEETDTTGTVIDGQKPEEEKTVSSEGE